MRCRREGTRHGEDPARLDRREEELHGPGSRGRRRRRGGHHRARPHARSALSASSGLERHRRGRLGAAGAGRRQRRPALPPRSPRSARRITDRGRDGRSRRPHQTVDFPRGHRRLLGHHRRRATDALPSLREPRARALGRRRARPHARPGIPALARGVLVPLRAPARRRQLAVDAGTRVGRSRRARLSKRCSGAATKPRSTTSPTSY